MKKVISSLALIGVFVLSGCFNTIEETTINDDGSGTIVNSVDMSKMISMLSAMGGDEKMKEAEKINVDTTIFLKNIKDSLGKLTNEEKKLIEKGSAHLVMNMKEEKFSISFTVPFSTPSEIPAVNAVLNKSTGKIMENMISKVMPDEKNGNAQDEMSMDNNEGTPDLSPYFKTTYEKNKMTKKVDKEKFAKVDDDASLKSLKEMGQMGMPLNFKTIINLPKPAKKAEGKGITISDDKKKITIEGTLEDFFEDPSKFEYDIEY